MSDLTLAQLFPDDSGREVDWDDNLPGDEGEEIFDAADEADLVALSNYLTQPTTFGFWRLTGTWQRQSAFSNFLFEQVKDKLVADLPKRHKPPVSPEVFARAHSATLDEITRRISLVFQAMHRLMYVERGETPTTLVSPLLNRYGSEIDWKEFARRFQSAANIFRERIFREGFDPTLIGLRPRVTKSGPFCVLSGPADGPIISLAFPTRASADAVHDFLVADLGVVSDVKVQRIFSPEDEVFQPYFAFLGATFTHVTHDVRSRPQFREAFTKYAKNDFRHCISTLGVIAEDYLAQVFETYLRKPAPKDATLGTLYDRLHEEISSELNPPAEGPKSLDETYELIRKVSDAAPGDQVALQESIVRVLRELTNIVKSERKATEQRIRAIRPRDNKLSVFNAQLRDNFEDLIGYRNAAAHKTRVVVGAAEALRMLYCLTSFVMWWNETRNATDWERDRETVLREAIARSSRR